MNKKRQPSDAVITSDDGQKTFTEIRDADAYKRIAKELEEREPNLADTLSVFVHYAIGRIANYAGGLSEEATSAVSAELHRAGVLAFRAVTLGYRRLLDADCPKLPFPESEDGDEVAA